MSLQSMTGFARTEGQSETLSWVWELRCVNGKGLEVRTRLPSGLEALETEIRSRFAKAFKRGNIQLGLQLSQSEGAALPKVNERAIDALLAAAKELQKNIGGPLPSAAELMAIKGIVEWSEEGFSGEIRDHRNKLLLDSLESAITQLSKMRQTEGSAVCNMLLEQIDKLEGLLGEIRSDGSRKPETIRKNLETQIARLLETDAEIDEQRLHQEAVIIAAKADLQEEIDRLSVHFKAAREMLHKGGPVGRKLDFLAQEFNRECNTICSKSNSAAITTLGLDMKLVIDQFREQVANLE